MRRSLVGKDDGIEAFKLFNLKERGGRLGFVFADGRRRSLPYFQLIETDYNPDLGGIVLTFVGHRVTIYGRNILRLYEGIEDEDVGEVTEKHANELAVPEADPYIKRIQVELIF